MTAGAAATFILGNTAALFLAAVCASMLCRDRTIQVRWIALIGCFILITSLTTLGLGLAGALYWWSPTGAVTLASVAVGVLRRKTLSRDLHRLVPAISKKGIRSSLDTLVTPVLSVIIGLIAVWVVKYTILGTFLTFDDKTYHAPSLVQWMLEGRISLTSFSYQSYYPFNAELLPLWLMMPFGNDSAVPLTGLVYAVLFFVISLEFGRRWNLPVWCRLIAPLLFLSSIEVVSQSNWFADVDIAAPVILLAGLAIGVRDRTTARFRQVILAGALTGFAVGMKSTFAPFAGILMLVITVRILLKGRTAEATLDRNHLVTRKGLTGAASNGLTFFAAATCAGAYWYIRNLALTANPLYPAKLGPFPGPFGGKEQLASTLVNAIRKSELSSAEYSEIGEMIFGWPATHAMLAVFAVIVSTAALLSRRRYPSGANAATVVALIIFAIVCVSLFPWMPFSARGDDGNFYLKGSSRYLTLAYLCGFLLLPRLLAWIESTTLGKLDQWLILCGLMLLLVTPLGLALDPKFSAIALCIMLISHAGLQAVAGGKLPVIFPLLEKSATWIFAFVAAITFATVTSPFSLRSTDRMHLETWMNAKIEELPEGSRVAMYFGLRPEFYTLYGRRYQHEPVRLSADGRPAVALHEREDKHGSRNFFDFAFDREVVVEPKKFLANIQESEIDFIVTPTMPHEGDAWPKQHAWLATLGVPVFCHSDEAVIWDLRPNAVASGSEPLPDIAATTPDLDFDEP